MRIKRFSDFSINEGLSSVLYHYTGAWSVLSILEKDRFSCSAALGSNSDNKLNKQKFFFFSMTRGKHGQTGYPRTHGSNTLSRIELNGEKLMQRYKGSPEDYWGRPRDPNDEMYGKMSPADKKHRMMADNEMEERILTDKPYIEKASAYIKGVDVCVDRKIPKTTVEMLEKIKKICTEKSITFRLYDDRAEFDKRGKTSDKLEVDHDYDDEKPYESQGIGPWTVTDLLRWALVQDPANKAAIQKFYEKVADKLRGEKTAKDLMDKTEEEAKKLSGDLRYAYERDIKDRASGLEAHIHNDRGKDDEVLKGAFAILFKSVRAAKATSIEEFIGKLAAARVAERRGQ